MSIASNLDAIQRRLARSSLAVRLSALVRNQCNAVIGFHLCPTPQSEQNGEAWLIRKLAPRCKRFVDAGANVGDWTALVLASAHPSVRGLLFEPSKGALASLRSRYGADPRIEIVESALGSTPGEARFYEEADGGESSSLIPTHVSSAGLPYVVHISTIDRELSVHGFDDVDFVKIDAEGFDARILRGAEAALSAHRLRVVQFEYNVNWLAAGDTLLNTAEWLRGFGYELSLLTSDGLSEFDYQRFGDFFRYSNFVALAPGSRALFQL